VSSTKKERVVNECGISRERNWSVEKKQHCNAVVLKRKGEERGGKEWELWQC